MDNCTFVDGNVLKIISNNCINLTHLSLIGCMNNPNNKSQMENNFHELKNLSKLTSLNLYRSLIDQESIKQIITSCKELRHLNLGSCVHIFNFDVVMELISENCEKIESLDLWRAYSLTSFGLNKIANKCFSLQEIDIGWW